MQGLSPQQKLAFDIRDKILDIAKDTDYKNFYLDNSWNTDNINDTGFILDIESGVSEPYKLRKRSVKIAEPRASVLIKKKAFSTLKFQNDMRYMSSNEIFLLRATKALFALKVQQIRSYEVLYKAREFSNKNDGMVNIAHVISLIDKFNRSQSLEYTNEMKSFARDGSNQLIQSEIDKYNAFVLNLEKNKGTNYAKQIGDMLSILKRNVYSEENLLTTFIVDYSNISNYGTGPGTGVIELTNFSSLSTNLSYDSNPSSLSMTLEDPYNISIITELDIDMAISEAINGSSGIFKNLLDGDIKFGLGINRFGMSSASSYDVSANDEIEFLSKNNLKNLDNMYSKIKRENLGIDIDYIFERLRVFYLGKPYVNPADGINVFIQSKGSRYRSGTDKASSIEEEINDISDVVLEAERSMFTSGEISKEVYKELRTLNENSFGFTHVFGGYVLNSSTSFSSGNYKLNFNCTDNMGWLSWSKFNETPSIDDPQGVLEDPLTPFKIPRDRSGEIDYSRPPEMLDENKDLISQGLLSYDSGLLRGQSVTESNLYQNEFSGIGSTEGKRVMQHPNGFVYNWKTGILTATAKFEPAASADGSNRSNYSAYTSNYVLPTVKNVLNNLDVANIISILTTGKPYNLVNFLKNSKEAITFMPEADRSALKNINENPLSSVIEVINKQNNFYGAFKPYKMITSGSQSYQKYITNSTIKENASSQIKDLEIKRAEIRDRIEKLNLSRSSSGVDFFNSSVDNIVKRYELELESITEKINREVGRLAESGVLESNQKNAPFFTFGGEGDGFLSFSEDDDYLRKIKSIVGAQRRIEDVRLNKDKNYFIVSDQYDVSLEIKPFLLELKNSGYKLFQSSYTDNLSKCKTAAAFLNLEFFCNSQGHLELRPPQWNKIPLSTLKSLIKTKKMSGKNVIPDYIMNLYETKEKNIAREIQRLNIRIVLISLLIGKFPDASVIPGMQSVGLFGESSLSFFGVSQFNSKGNLNYASSGDRLSGSTDDLNTGWAQSTTASLSFDFSSNGNVLNGDVTTILGDFSPEISGSFQGLKSQEDSLISAESGLGNPSLGGLAQGVTLGGSGLVNEILLYSKGSASPPSIKYSNPDTLNKIRGDFKNLFGADPGKDLLNGKPNFEIEDFVFKSAKKGQPESYSDKINRIMGNSTGGGSLLSKLKNTISERDKNVSLLERNREKKRKFEELNSILTSGDSDTDYSDGSALQGYLKNLEEAGTYILDTLNYNRDPSSPYDELIEDDSTNILGYGSGSRFVVDDDQIISASYSENPPEYTRVNVTGSAELGIGDSLSSATEGFYFWSGAADFDLWRQYGYKSQSFPVPFFSSAEHQCKPYAYFMLQLQRSKINSGSLTLVGNEFYQPGDVVYVKSKGLLYYVKSVNHSFSYGQSYTTTLSLEYGHPAGVYMPNPFDLFGMQLTSNISSHNVPVYRSSRGDDYYRELSPESALVLPSGGFNEISRFLSYSDNQSRFYNMMLGLTSGAIIGGSKKLLIRGFVKKSSSSKVDELRDSLMKIKQLFVLPQMLSSGVPDKRGGLSFEEFSDLASQDSSGFGQTPSGGLFGTGYNSINPLNLASGRLVPLKLPNGELAGGIPEKDIIIQINFLDKETSNSEITCMDGSGLNFLDDSGILKDEARIIFPGGGMRQNTFLDFRQMAIGQDIIQLAEVGIVDLKRYKEFEKTFSNI